MVEELLDPINTIITFADVLLKDDVHPLSAEYAQFTQHIYHNGVRLRDLILEDIPPEMLRSSSHEIRTPLTSILGFSHLMLDFPGLFAGAAPNADQQKIIMSIHQLAHELMVRVNATIFNQGQNPI